jgi:hypothetical protein
MKHYPSIPRSTGQNFREFTAYVFDKLDGSNLRAEWTRKRGWDKYGTRERLFDKTDEVFGEAIEIFKDTLASDIEAVAKKQQWQQLTIFMEFWGDQSFAGLHVKGDPKRLTLFDANPYKKESWVHTNSWICSGISARLKSLTSLEGFTGHGVLLKRSASEKTQQE